MFVGVNVTSSWLLKAIHMLHSKVSMILFKYLGLLIGVHPRRLSFQAHLLKTLKKRLSLEVLELVYGQTTCSFKICIFSISNYFIFFFKTPSGIIFLIESIFNLFLREGNDETHKVHLNYEFSGLGIFQTKEFNLALLGKWFWRLMFAKGVLWYKVLAYKYEKIKEGS